MDGVWGTLVFLLQEQIREPRREEKHHAEGDEYGNTRPDVIQDFLRALVE